MTNRFIPTTLTASDRPSWPIRTLRSLGIMAAQRIEPELVEYETEITFDRHGVAKLVRQKDGSMRFGELNGNQFVINRPSADQPIDPEKALAHNRGFVYAAVNAIAREVMSIDWQMFQATGKTQKELEDHECLDLLENVNDSMMGIEFKYLLSALLLLTGNAYVYLEGVGSDTDKPKAIHLMPSEKVRPVIDRRSWPYTLMGYRLKLENQEQVFEPYEVIHFKLPNPADFTEGMSPLAAGAEYIDNDNAAMEFNRKFFRNGARPVGFLETDYVADTQLEVLKTSFEDMHGGLDNMNRVGALPKGVKWNPTGASQKDMDFAKLSTEMKDRILAMFGVSKTILGTAESDTNRATSETADYVFSRRVILPHMTLIAGFLNRYLVPRYGDDLYISFVNPVPQDREFRAKEMQIAMGNAPIMTANEAREHYMGLGPVDGGDTLMGLTLQQPLGQPTTDTDPDPQEAKGTFSKSIRFHPARTKASFFARKVRTVKQGLTEDIVAAVSAFQSRTTKSFTPEQDAAFHAKVSDRTAKAEQEIAAALKTINDNQKAEVLDNLPKAIGKSIDAKKLFDLAAYIAIVAAALTPILTSLFESQAKEAADELGKPELNPLEDDATAKALTDAIEKASESYETTIQGALAKTINEGLDAGKPLADLTKDVADIYEGADDYGAKRVAKTEAFRTANASLNATWAQSGTVKTVKWYTTSGDPCPFCQSLNGKTVDTGGTFAHDGDTLEADGQSMTLDYGDVDYPPLHPQCQCITRPDQISI